MINHDDFIIEEIKPKENSYFLFRIVDPERDKKYKTIDQMAKAHRSKIFIGGVFYLHDILERLQNNYFDRIKYVKENNNNILVYSKEGKDKKILFPENLKTNDFTNIMRDAGYDINLEFKDKAYKRKKGYYDYNVFLIKEKLETALYQEMNITNRKLAKEIFEKCWKDSNEKTIATQIAFMKQIILFKKIGEEI
jgi:hypothetical protein